MPGGFKGNSRILSQNMGDEKNSVQEILALHLPPPMVLLVGIWVLARQCGFNLVDHPVQTLLIAGVWQVMFSTLMYAMVAVNQKRCSSVWQAVCRSLFILPVGAIAAVFVAFIFGAPLDLAGGRKMAYWGQLTSAIVAIPAGIVLGGSLLDWQRLFAFTRPAGALEYSICIPAHGAVIGAWFGAWPMPLDWERPWQEWPVCVTYGMVAGYCLGTVVSISLLLVRAKKLDDKQD